MCWPQYCEQVGAAFDVATGAGLAIAEVAAPPPPSPVTPSTSAASEAGTSSFVTAPVAETKSWPLLTWTCFRPACVSQSVTALMCAADGPKRAV